MTGAHEMMLDTTSQDFDGKSEARYLAQCITDVNAHYSSMLDQKTTDWCNLILAIGTVYGSRLYNIRHRVRAERATPVKPMAVNPAHPPQHQRPAAHANGGDAPVETRRGIVPGLGDVEFPADHPLAPKADPNGKPN